MRFLNNGRNTLRLGVAFLAIGVVLSTAWFVGGFRGSFEDPILAVVKDTPSINPFDNSKELCRLSFCSAGWTTDVGDYMEFRSEARARYWSLVDSGEFAQNGKILLKWRKTDLTFGERRLAVDILYANLDLD